MLRGEAGTSTPPETRTLDPPRPPAGPRPGLAPRLACDLPPAPTPAGPPLSTFRGEV